MNAAAEDAGECQTRPLAERRERQAVPVTELYREENIRE